jgi:hypothetical protein
MRRLKDLLGDGLMWLGNAIEDAGVTMWRRGLAFRSESDDA